MLNPVTYIRRDVFKLSQGAFGALFGKTQASVSRWEKARSIPNEIQPFVRDAARQQGLNWNDSWFFEAPEGGSGSVAANAAAPATA
jgi:hypothetical protein